LALSSHPIIGRFMATLYRRHLEWLGCALALSATAVGCGGGGDNGGTPPSTTAIAKTTTNNGDAQTATVGQPLANPLQVVVTENGAPSAGATVTWSSTATNATLDPTSATTDANGVASSAWTLGTVSGSQSAQATLSGASGSPVSFTATAAPDAAATLAKAGGDQQNGTINTQLTNAVQAKVSDQFGNGVPGVEVTWEASGATTSAASVPTSGSGISAVNVTLGGTAGSITITATSGTLAGSPQIFTATANDVPSTTTISVINDQFVPSSITVAAGTTVTWTWGAGATNHDVVPDGTIPTSSGIPANAPHTYQFTFSIPGTYLYHCSVHGAAGGIGMSGTVTVQ
jgi:plastocyanin